MARQPPSLKETLDQQHDEMCKDFQQLHVCPRGARCQRLHLYTEIRDDHYVKMMDFMIGVLYDHTKSLAVIKSQLDSISSHLKLDTAQVQSRGRTRGETESKRQARQVTSRSKSADRYVRSRRGSRSSTPVPQEVQQAPLQSHPTGGTPYPIGFSPYINPPTAIGFPPTAYSQFAYGIHNLPAPYYAHSNLPSIGDNATSIPPESNP